jgi:hypothetical protein
MGDYWDGEGVKFLCMDKHSQTGNPNGVELLINSGCNPEPLT